VGVRKFRTVADAPAHPPRQPRDPENLRIAVDLMVLAARMSPVSATPGVRKFRTYDELLRFHARREADETSARRLADARRATASASPGWPGSAASD